jgi:hypothetical protein
VTALNAATECMIRLLCTVLVQVSFLSPKVGYPSWGSLWFFRVLLFTVHSCKNAITWNKKQRVHVRLSSALVEVFALLGC